jgi:hypothetical protein
MIKYCFHRLIKTNKGTPYIEGNDVSHVIASLRKHYPNITKNLSDEDILNLLDKLP